MKYKIIIFIAIVVFLSLITTKLAIATNEAIVKNNAEEVELEAQNALQEKINAMTTVELIDHIAPRYGQDPALIKKITYCESNHNPNANHDGGHGQGSTGFHRATFNDWKVKFGHPEYIYESNFDQIALMAEAFSKGESYRRAWTTYRAYSNGGVYSFYSNLLKGNYTVVCK